MWLYLPRSITSNFAPAPGCSVSESNAPHPDCEPSVTSRGKPMPRQTLSRAWMKVRWMRRLSGMTYALSTADAGVDAWIGFLRASRASHTPLPAEEKESRTSGGFGPTLPESFATWSPGKGCFLRTFGDSFLLPTEGLLPKFSGTWPNSGSMSNGDCFERATWVPPTSARGSSSWPTVRACSGDRSSGANRTELVETWATPDTRRCAPGAGTTARDGRHRDLNRESENWATPSACIANDGEDPETWIKRAAGLKEKHGNGNGAGTPLTVQSARWATPRGSDGEKGGPNQRDGSGSLHLTSQSAAWPTPTGSDYKGATSTGMSVEKKHLSGIAEQEFYRSSPSDQEPQPGPQSSTERRTLNPLFVEWLMGWPAGWTDCECAVTGSSRWKRRLRSEFWRIVLA